MKTKLIGNKTSTIVLTAMVMCLIMVAIFIFRIPIPFTQGYVNLSDGIIFIGVVLLGRTYGTVAAALGSMMGDIIGGFAMWAPWTFAIKGGMALIMALIIGGFVSEGISEGKKWLIRVIGMACGGIFMVLGYFVAEKVMYGNWAVAALGIPWNVGQFVVGIVLAVCILKVLSKVPAINKGGML